ncbi:MAG: hypothetical protein HFJ41_09535, partial [Clostridia bacterium]|nr:hypothetical protein [Clostridia bacterium]
PQLALPIMLSNNVARRTRIQAVFQFCGAIAGLVIQSYALPMIEACGGQDNPLAWTKVIAGDSVSDDPGADCGVCVLADRNVAVSHFQKG